MTKMEKTRLSAFFLRASWCRWQRWVAWMISIGAISLLGALRVATDAEFAFASLALLPVMVISWMDGRRNGLILAFIVAAMWAASDMTSGREFSAAWIPWVNALTRLMIYGLVAFLTAQVRQQFAREYEFANRDALTGLLNRRAFLNAGSAEVERSKRYAHPMTVVFLDLDDFKQLNDTMGHDAGDAALHATAVALRSALRSNDQIARLGGDEFAVLLPEIDYDAAVEAGRKISIAVGNVLDDFPPVKASIGVAWFRDMDRLFPAMLKAADELMYEVKESGKNDVLSRRIAATSKPST